MGIDKMRKSTQNLNNLSCPLSTSNNHDNINRRIFRKWCCKTVLPAPKGPGEQKVPPLITGNCVSKIRIPVSIISDGFNLSLPEKGDLNRPFLDHRKMMLYAFFIYAFATTVSIV